MSVHDELGEFASSNLVTVSRTLVSETLDGYILASGPGVVLVGIVDPAIYHNGVAALVRSSIANVAAADPDYSQFVRRALAMRDQSWPDVSWCSCEDLTSFVATIPLGETVTIYDEREYPDECYIGRLEERSDTEVFIRELSIAATWDTDLTSFGYETISRVDLWGRYEEALTRVADVPAWRSSGRAAGGHDAQWHS